jgi:hypothetical protein
MVQARQLTGDRTMKRILVIAAAMLIVMLSIAPTALAADLSTRTDRILISTNGDVTVPAGEHADLVVVVRGTATIAGDVDTIVTIDGTADLTGAQAETVIAVRSTVNLAAGTVVAGDVIQLDSVIQTSGGAEILGEVKDGQAWLVGLGVVLAPAFFLMWIGVGLAIIVAGLLVAGIAGRQVRAAGALISHEPVTTLVAGILGLVVIPVVAILLMITIVGAPLGAGILLGLWPLVAFVGYLVAGVWIGEWILHRLQPTVVRERPYVASVIGLLSLQALSLVPILAIVASIASLFGFGAVLLLAWRTLRSGAAPRTTVTGAAPMPLAG